MLDEEMRRVLEFCTWKETWWLTQAPRREDASDQLEDGLHAYAQEQADQERRICLAWRTKWARARLIANPILDAFWGVDRAPSVLDATDETVVIELDINEDDGDAGDSDFEE